MIKRGIKEAEASQIAELNQLIKILENAFGKFKEAFEKKDLDNFNKSKKIIIQIQKEIFRYASSEKNAKK